MHKKTKKDIKELDQELAKIATKRLRELGFICALKQVMQRETDETKLIVWAKQGNMQIQLPYVSLFNQTMQIVAKEHPDTHLLYCNNASSFRSLVKEYLSNHGYYFEESADHTYVSFIWGVYRSGL